MGLSTITFAAAVLLASGAAASDAAAVRAVEKAQEFTGKFVAGSCTERKCEFVTDNDGVRIQTSGETFVVELKGRSRKIGEQIEARHVSARVSLELLNNEETPLRLVVRDFTFQEGRRIPIPTK